MSVNEEFNCVVSGLALHLVEYFDALAAKVFRWLCKGGHFVFSVRHPIRTALPTGACRTDGRPGWAVSGYYDVGLRSYSWLGQEVTYYHRSIEQYFHSLSMCGFEICDIREPHPVGLGQSAKAQENSNVPAVILFLCRKPE